MAFWNSKSKSKERESTIDWATADIRPNTEWMKFVGTNPLPDWFEVSQRCIQLSGRDPSCLNQIEVMLMVSRVVIGNIKRYLDSLGDKSGPHELDMLASREDFTFQMLENFLTHRGATGVAIVQKISELLNGDQFQYMIAGLIRDGHADLTEDSPAH